MFHRYILAQGARQVDFDRASFLMDKKLLNDAERVRIQEMNSPHNRLGEIKYDLQWLWNDYCQRHLEKYGEPFEPDVDLNWDS